MAGNDKKSVNKLIGLGAIGSVALTVAQAFYNPTNAAAEDDACEPHKTEVFAGLQNNPEKTIENFKAQGGTVQIQTNSAIDSFTNNVPVDIGTELPLASISATFIKNTNETTCRFSANANVSTQHGEVNTTWNIPSNE